MCKAASAASAKKCFRPWHSIDRPRPCRCHWVTVRGRATVSSLLAHEDVRDDRNLTGRRWTPTTRPDFWIELTFDKPVVVDSPVGADAHFSAGQFCPVLDADTVASSQGKTSGRR